MSSISPSGITIANALTSLGIKNWIFRGDEATTEAEFNERV